MGVVAGGWVGGSGSVGGCSAVTGTSDWSIFGRGENGDSGAFGFAGSLVDEGIWGIWTAQPVTSIKEKTIVTIHAAIVTSPGKDSKDTIQK